MNAEGDAGEGAELMFDTMLAGKDGSATYETGGGNRIPLGDNSTVPPQERARPRADHRPRRAVVHPARAAHRGAGLRRLVGLGRRDGHPHRRAARARRLPDLRRQPADAVAQDATSAPARCATSTSPARWRRCSPRPSLIDAGKVTPEHPDHRALGAAARRPGDPRLLPARQAPPDADRRDREVLQHRHGAGRRASSSPASSTTTCASSGSAPRTGIGVARRVGRRAATTGASWSQINQDTIAFGQGLAVNAVQMAAAVNADRQRRRLRAAEPGQGRGHHLRRRGGRLRHRHGAPGDQRPAPPG